VIKVVMTSNATPCLVGSPVTSNTVTMVVNPNLTAGVSIAAGANNVCSGTSVTFTATPTNGGTSPSYQWYKGTTAVGTNSATYTYAPANGDVIKVVMTSNATPCLVGSPVTSNTVTMVVNPNLTAGVSIAASTNPSSTGVSVTYTATPTNGGSAPIYQWYVNSLPVGTGLVTYNYTPANNDVITVKLTSNATPCLVGSPVTSNAITQSVSVGTSVDQKPTININVYSMHKNIFVDCPVQAKEIYIYNTLGSAIMLQNNVLGIRKFDLNQYPKAYYFVKILTENNVYTKKVLLK
jgi:hypothetical protein